MFGDDPDPAGAWRPRAARDPAAADALRERRPLLADVVPGPRRPGGRPAARPRPAHPQRLRPLPADRRRLPRRTSTSSGRSSRWDDSFRQARSSGCVAVDGGFELDGARRLPSRPARTGASRARRAGRARADRRACTLTSRTSMRTRVAIVGAGMAAATEWLNALEAGAEVVSVRRREPARRPLNVASAALHASAASRRSTRLAPAERAALLRALRRAVVPARPQLGRAARAGGAGGALPGRADLNGRTAPSR